MTHTFLVPLTPSLPPTARLREYVLSLPVSAFVQPRDITRLDFLNNALGVNATAQPMVWCERLGARENGNSLVFDLPEGAGPGVAVMIFHEMVDGAWDDLPDVGDRIGHLVKVVSKDTAWAAPSMTELALLLIRETIEGNDPFATATGTVSLNWAGPVWALSHVYGSLSPAEAAEVERRSAEKHDPEDLAMVTERRRGADELKANLPHADEVMDVLSGAIAEFIEDRVTSNDIEAKPLSQGLLQTPRTAWADEARRIVAAALAPALTGANAR